MMVIEMQDFSLLDLNMDIRKGVWLVLPLLT